MSKPPAELTVERVARAMCIQSGNNPDRMLLDEPAWTCWREPSKRLLEDEKNSDYDWMVLVAFCDQALGRPSDFGQEISDKVNSIRRGKYAH